MSPLPPSDTHGASSSVPSPERLLELIDAMADRPVVLVADLVVDRFLTGTPKRISREAPVLILSYEGERIAPGGGANAAANVVALGGRPLLLGAVGDDANGDDLLADLAGRGIDTAGVLVRSDYRTPTKVRILGGGKHSIKQQIVRYDIEDNLVLTEADRLGFAARLAEWRTDYGLGDRATAILSDYGYGTVEPAVLPVLRAALGPEATLLCDSRYRLGEFRGLDGATPNEEEAEALLGQPIEDAVEPLARAGRTLRDRLGAGFLLVTRGSRGMSLFEERGGMHLPVHGTDQVADVTGAGDTVIGTFALALAAGASPLEAALLANYAGGIVVMKMGTATLSRDELASAVRADPQPIEGLQWVG